MNRTVSKLLVANRGEIARRIFATCRQMGIATVAVYSDPDRDAVFVKEADEGFNLGGAAPADSYLRIDAVIAAAIAAGANAIHPGYGFLSENASFAQAVNDAGLIWVGPSPEAIETMGAKLAAKQLMEEAGVPTLPSVDLTGLSAAEMASAAAEIGFPVLVKASAGGGGKGMRIVETSDDLNEAVSGAQRESLSAFGDDTVFLERYLPAPRHVEIQVFADDHGNAVSLFERECSIQRRHQKIIEESPSPAIDETTRQRMGEAAVAAASAVDYRGAGTVEFLFSDGDFYFLEMNTRLQVEHPVTELTTGLDLVRLQILVAQGEPLPTEALAPARSGHAIEARLYAEDVGAGFLPVTGTLSRVRFPEMEGIRIDSGVEDGSEVSVHYDPMLAKVVAWAPSRTEAAARLARALERAELHGSVTNRELLVGILRHPEFISGQTDTAFLLRHDPSKLGTPATSLLQQRRAAVAAAMAAQTERHREAAVLATIPSGWRNVASQYQVVRFANGDDEIEVGYRFSRSGVLSVEGFDTARLISADPELVGIELDGHLGWYRIHRVDDVVYVDGPAGSMRLVEQPRFPSVDAEEQPGSLRAPMPGTVIRVDVAPGDTVEEGTILAVMEAMKMEHTLRSPHAGVVSEVDVAPGDLVVAEQVLVVVGPDDIPGTTADAIES